MPLVPTYEADLRFIAAPSGNVDAFRDALVRRMGDRLGGQLPTIVGPKSRDDSASSSEEVRDALAIVLIEAHRHSPETSSPSNPEETAWLSQALHAFHQSTATDEMSPENRQPRAFLVTLGDCKHERLPEAVRGLPTFELSGDRLSWASQLEPLTTVLVRRLNELRRGEAASVVRPTVFLAEPTRDVTQAAQQLQSYLEVHGCRVVPQERLSQASTGYLERFAHALSQSQLFVQLVGKPESDTSPFSCNSPQFPGGFGDWQYQQARSTGLPILRWQSGAMLAEKSTDAGIDAGPVADGPFPEAESLVRDGGDVVRCDFEQFRSLVLEELRSPPRLPSSNSQRTTNVVLITAAQGDEGLAEELREQIRNLAVENGASSTDVRPTSRLTPKMVLGNLSLEREARRYAGFRGVIVVQGGADNDWLERQVFTCRRLSLALSRQRAGYAIWTTSLERIERRWLPPGFQRLANVDRPALAAFLQSLAESRA